MKTWELLGPQRDELSKQTYQLTNTTQHPSLLMTGKEYKQKVGIAILAGIVTPNLSYAASESTFFYTGTHFCFEVKAKHPRTHAFLDA